MLTRKKIIVGFQQLGGGGQEDLFWLSRIISLVRYQCWPHILLSAQALNPKKQFFIVPTSATTGELYLTIPNILPAVVKRGGGRDIIMLAGRIGGVGTPPKTKKKWWKDDSPTIPFHSWISVRRTHRPGANPFGQPIGQPRSDPFFCFGAFCGHPPPGGGETRTPLHKRDPSAPRKVELKV